MIQCFQDSGTTVQSLHNQIKVLIYNLCIEKFCSIFPLGRPSPLTYCQVKQSLLSVKNFTFTFNFLKTTEPIDTIFGLKHLYGIGGIY